MERCQKHGNVVDPARAFVPDSDDCFECWPEVPGKRAWKGGGWAVAPAAPPARSLPCVHEGAVTDYCPCADPLGLRHVRQCCHPTADRDACTRVSLGGPVQGCDRCPDYDSGRRAVAVATSGQGIGDAVSQLYACVGLVDAGFDVTMRSNHDLGWFAGVSHPGLTLTGPGDGVDCNPDYPGQCRAADAGAVASRCQWYCDRLAERFGVPPFAPARPRSVAKPAPVREAGYVVLSPFSLHADREWPVERWRQVAVRLHERGLAVVAIDRPGGDARLRQTFGGTPTVWHWGSPPAWTAALIAHADLLVGNDSGMAHVAGLYGVPGVAVMTLFPFPFVFAEAPSLVGVGGHRGSLADVPAAAVLAAVDDLAPAAGPVDVTAVVREKLGQRAGTTAYLFDRLRQWTNPRVVETGCVRSREDWSAGYFTWLCGAVLDGLGAGDLVSVDIDPANVATARRLCSRWPRVRVVESDSVAYLRGRTEPIDLLYADSMDTYVEGHAEHALAEAQAGERLVSEGGLIVFDDSPKGSEGWTGKGRLAVPWLVSRGWRVRPESGYQTAVERA